MPEHDPVAFAAALSGKLAARSRHVCMFLGAGAARACGLPDLSQLQATVLAALTSKDKKALERQLKRGNLESALSRLRRIAALATDAERVDGLTAAESTALDATVCQEIVKALDIASATLGPVYHLAAWSGRAGYQLPVELFTINYDLLIETALESLRVPYFDGFVGTMRARFHTALVEGTPSTTDDWVPAFFVRVWKLHGSVNWAWDSAREIRRLGGTVPNGDAAAIYPSDTKYEESRRVPFVVLQDRFRRALHHPETLTLVTGYSFGDAHLNELIFEAAQRRQRSEIIVFAFEGIPDVVATQAARTPNLQIAGKNEAILSGVRASWRPPEVAPRDVWEGGSFALPDFAKLAIYLSRSAAQDPERQSELAQLLATSDPAPAPRTADGPKANA